MENKNYNELKELKTFEDRLNYLKLSSEVGDETFGHNRYINQQFYKSDEWLKVRDKVILRDNGCDLGIDGLEILGPIYVHHIRPITLNDLLNKESWITDPNYLISTSFNTHNSIHYGKNTLVTNQCDRKPNDTCLWKREVI